MEPSRANMMNTQNLLIHLKEKNPDKNIFWIGDKAFESYGRPCTLPGQLEMTNWASGAVDSNGPVYIPHYDYWNGSELLDKLEKTLYGSFPAQIGSCCGMNRKMNGMEYHKSHEYILALTDLVLILGSIKDIRNGEWNSSLGDYFYIEKGQAVEIYTTTLHLAPCRVDDQPFRSLIILPKGTNYPLNYPVPNEDPLLFMANKWFLCHPESPAADRGAVQGICGANPELLN
jgi:Domain of unknown function (DUF4867)